MAIDNPVLEATFERRVKRLAIQAITAKMEGSDLPAEIGYIVPLDDDILVGVTLNEISYQVNVAVTSIPVAWVLEKES